MNLELEMEKHKNNRELVDLINYLKNECEVNPDNKTKLENTKKSISGGVAYLREYAKENQDKYTIEGGGGVYVESLEGFKLILDYLIEDGIKPTGADKPKTQPATPTKKELKEQENENKAPRNDLNPKNEQEVKNEPKVARNVQKRPKIKEEPTFTLFDL